MERQLKNGQRVAIAGKDIRGTIAYCGLPNFASGKWVGVILDEPKGKNNGTIKGVTYFNCPENYGMFVRPTHLILLDDQGQPLPDQSNLSASKSNTSLNRTWRKSPPKPRTVMSTSSSQISLSGSRQSLSGSRSTLVSPATDRSYTLNESQTSDHSVRDATSTNIVAGSSKRASFVETGFVETLKPQYTPGQSLTSPSPALTMEDKITNLQHQQEVDTLQSTVRDLTEKLETMKLRRSEDRERIKELEKLMLVNQQLQEFKTKIMDAHAQLQKDLQRAKQEAREAVEAKEAHAEEMADLSETVEMATLDKEMAEEKAETLQIELETAREKMEELSLDLELLKEAQSAKGGTINTTEYDMKQLEQHNNRLRETLVRMRDLSAHEKHEMQKMQKDLDQKKSELTELTRTKEKLSARVEEQEFQIADLQEQVDAALGAEEMVEQLGEKKMELEDKMKQLQEEISELEALQDVHEQLVESNQELELDLREELDLANAARREALREKEAMLETILDRDSTIMKFRELVQKINDQNIDLRNKLESESAKLVSDPVESLDFKQMFLETKEHTRAVDLQIRKIELTQANEHVKYLTAYMPDTFMNRGGDHDAILVLLLVSRLVWKLDILAAQVRERFPPITKIDRNAVLQDHEVHQYSFRCRFVHFIHVLQSILQQFSYGLNICSPEELLRAGSTFPEMSVQERTVDNFVDLLKRNQLDENSQTDVLEKCIGYFTAMHMVLLPGAELLNEVQLIRDIIASWTAAMEGLITDGCIIRAVAQTGGDKQESSMLAQHIITTAESVQQQLKLCRRRLPQDTTSRKIGFRDVETLKACQPLVTKVLAVTNNVSKLVVPLVTASGDHDNSVPENKLWEAWTVCCERVYEQDDLGPAQSIRKSLSAVLMASSNLAQFLTENEDLIHTSAPVEATTPPIVLRSQIIKKQLEETKTLTAKLENKEAEIRELKKSAKARQDEFSEMQIRKDLAEKKLGTLNKDSEVQIEKLQKKYDEAVIQFKRKEKEFEQTLDHLQTDIDTLELERGTLREKVKGLAKGKGIDIMKHLSSPGSPTTAGSHQEVISAALPAGSLQELTALENALKAERNERINIQAEHLKKALHALEPIYVRPAKKIADSRVNELTKEFINVKHEWIMSMAKSALCSLPDEPTKRMHALQNFNTRQAQKQVDLMAKMNALHDSIKEESVQRQPWRFTQTALTAFQKV